jgi:hypothetical protein
VGDSEPVTPQFVPGLELSRRLFEQAVRPLLTECFPGLPYSAARIGSGSEVLGHDTERSTDHDWGARLQVFLSDDDVEHVAEPVRAVLSERLPTLIAGWAPWVEVTGVADWFSRSLGFDPRAGVTTFDWLATPGQRLAEVTGGVVLHDGLGELAVVRERLRWYPDQLWWHLMACQWERIAEEEAFPGRCAEVGDELGCRIQTGRLVRDIMRLALLVDRRHTPYAKWLGTAFSRSPSAARLGPPLRRALAADGWPAREAALGEAYRHLAARHNALGLTAALDESTRDYHDRPFQVLDAARFAEALRALITDEETVALGPIGSVDQFVDSTAVLTDPHRARAALRGVLAG